MYTPALREDQVKNLYRLAKLRKQQMTKILRQIMDEYCESHQDELEQLVVITTRTIAYRRTA